MACCNDKRQVLAARRCEWDRVKSSRPAGVNDDDVPLMARSRCECSTAGDPSIGVQQEGKIKPDREGISPPTATERRAGRRVRH